MEDSGVNNDQFVRQFCVVASTDDGATWNSVRVAGVTWMSAEQAQDVHQACSMRARRYGLPVRYRVLSRTVAASSMWPDSSSSSDVQRGYRKGSEDS